MAWVVCVLSCLGSFIKDFQTLIAGLLAIGAAWMTARPVWRQLDRMSVQTGTMYREFLAERLKALLVRRKWLFERISPFQQEVNQRLYEMREFENGLNIHWVFERSQIASSLRRELEAYRATSRDPAEMTEALDKLIIALKALEDDLYDIHRPTTTDQSGEDYAYTDEQWAEIGRKAKEADSALDGLLSGFNAASRKLGDAVDLEVSHLRDRLKETDDNLLNGKP